MIWRQEQGMKGLRMEERSYRVASGFEDTCGSERNSSRSIVPELSLNRRQFVLGHQRHNRCGRGDPYLIQLHKALAQSVNLFAVDFSSTPLEFVIRAEIPGSMHKATTYNSSLVQYSPVFE